jgi:hypothetical protein
MRRPRPTLVVFAIIAACASAVLYAHCRAASGVVGIRWDPLVRNALATAMGALLPLLGVAWFLSAGSEFLRVQRMMGRTGAGCCAGCGYEVDLGAGRCPECGSRTPLRLERARSRTGLRAAVVAAFLGGAIGVVVSEALMLADERAFRREAAAWEASGGLNKFSRGRWWPNSSASLVYIPGKGYFSTE